MLCYEWHWPSFHLHLGHLAASTVKCLLRVFFTHFFVLDCLNLLDFSYQPIAVLCTLDRRLLLSTRPVKIPSSSSSPPPPPPPPPSSLSSPPPPPPSSPPGGGAELPPPAPPLLLLVLPHPRHMEVPGQGLSQSCSCWPTPQPQQRQIPVESATWVTPLGNTRSLAHWVRPGIEPTSSWVPSTAFLTR